MSDIIERYQNKILDIYMQVHPDADRHEVLQLINNVTEQNLRDIPCKMHNNVKHEMIETTMTNVLSWTETSNPIISGAGSFFKQHKDYLSPSTIMLENLMDDRSSVKNEMWKYEKASIEYVNLNTQQGSIKVIMNADYGGSGTPLSPFYSQYIPPATTGTAKNITTTLICCLEYSSDNPHRYAKLNSINELFDMIFIVLNDDENREFIDATFTVDEVVERLSSRVNDIRLPDIKLLRMYLKTLSPFQLTKLMLAFNVRLVLKRFLQKEVGMCMDYFRANQIDVDDMSEENMQRCGFGKKCPEGLTPIIDRIKKVVLDNCVYPFILNDAEVRAANMTRQVVCVTDTDSLMVHFAHYIDEFQSRITTGPYPERDSAILASALGVRLFVEGIIPKFVGYVASGCNINDKYYRDKFIFKNEFGFLSMALFAKKMYAASMFVQEGNPRDIHSIAVTGLSFKKRDAAEFLEPIMERLYDQYILTPRDGIHVDKLLDEYYATREMLKREAPHNTTYYQVLSYKDKNAYDQSRRLPNQVIGSLVWNYVFPDEEILPQDRVIVVPLSRDKVIANRGTSENIEKIYKFASTDDPNGKYDIIICLPENYKEIPEWLQPCIDLDKLIDKLLSPFQQILGLFDVVMPTTVGGVTASRMLYL